MRQDIVAAENIFVPDFGILNGKAPAIDIMYVNGIPFLIMISRNIQFGSAQALPDENISLSTLPYKRLSRSTRTMVLLSHTYLEMGN